MHFTTSSLLTLITTAALWSTFVAAEAVPDHPIRIQAMRGRAPSRKMADEIAKQLEHAPERLVWPEAEEDPADKTGGGVEEIKKAVHVARPDGDPNNMDDYPACSKICTPPALKASGCKFPEDVECMCRCPIFGDIAQACEEEKCSAADIDVIHELGGKMCEPVGGFRPKKPESCKKKQKHGKKGKKGKGKKGHKELKE